MRVQRTWRRQGRGIAVATAMLLTAISAIVIPGASAREPRFAIQPIRLQRIDLPAKITGARWPEFTHDGKHLLFFDRNDLWITNLQGHGVKCLTCGQTDDPAEATAPTADLATPFP